MKALQESFQATTKQPVKLENILFATDFSEASSAIMPVVATLARAHGARIYLFHSLEPSSSTTTSPESVQHAERESSFNVARERLQVLAHARMCSDLRTTPIVRCGPPIDQLEDVIERKDIDIVVIGTHGQRGFKRSVIGSYAEDVSRHLHCPVMTVGPNALRNDFTGGVNSILYATDMSSESWTALDHAQLFASTSEPRIRFLHVLPHTTGLNSDAGVLPEPLADELQKTVRKAGFPDAECTVDFGNAAEVILGHADEMSPDLIIMGIPKLVGLEGFFPANVTSRVMIHASCPVLTVRESTKGVAFRGGHVLWPGR
jgi:nucleotide-binding universal stress UspA family protein